MKDNVVIICSIENVDPMGVHTGDSITIAPAQTLTDKEYQRLRDAAVAIIREMGVETGRSLTTWPPPFLDCSPPCSSISCADCCLAFWVSRRTRIVANCLGIAKGPYANNRAFARHMVKLLFEGRSADLYVVMCIKLQQLPWHVKYCLTGTYWRCSLLHLYLPT